MNEPGGNGHIESPQETALKDFIHSPDSTDKALKSGEQLNAMRMMLLMDERFKDNLLRLDFPSSRFILAVSLSMQRCMEHGYTNGMEWLEMICGMLPAKHAKRMEHFIDGMAGERRWREGGGQGQSGLMDKMKNWMGGQH